MACAHSMYVSKLNGLRTFYVCQQAKWLAHILYAPELHTAFAMCGKHCENCLFIPRVAVEKNPNLTV